MSAHTFRTWLWESQGSVLWNAQWYGGHHAAGYSMLFPPLAGLVGPRAIGVIAGVAAVLAFGWLAARAGRTPVATALAAWLFASGIVANVVIGRMPFTLGVACAVGAWACAVRSTQGGRRSGAAARPRRGPAPPRPPGRGGRGPGPGPWAWRAGPASGGRCAS